MKISIFLFAAIMILTSAAFSKSDPGPMPLCPRFYCVAGADGSDYHHPSVGYGYDDVVPLAQAKAVRMCTNNLGPNCRIIGCFKNTGPVFKLFVNCQSQW